jgi:hypothetical protein
MDKQILINALTAQDQARPRSKQTAIGVSSLGSCRRKVWLELAGTPKTNPTKSLAAIMGTAIHAAIEAAFANNPRFLIENRVEIDGLPPATIDCYDTEEMEIIDWKTTKKSNLSYFPSKQQRWQVQVYGYLMNKSAYPVKTVSLVAIARDGDEDDIVVYSEPYNPAIAEEALAWLTDLQNTTEAPAPEKDAASFCRNYCEFYGSACNGIGKDYSGNAITDEAASKAASEYIAIGAEIKALEAQQEAAKAALVGVSGVTMQGVKVSWSEVAGRTTPDLDAIKALLPTVPMKTGQPSIRLSVK